MQPAVEARVGRPPFVRSAAWVLALSVLASAAPGSGEAWSAPERASNATVYAWFPARFGSWDTRGIQWDCITHLCFRSVVLKADGNLETPAGNPPRELVDEAHRRGVKVTVLVWVNTAEESDGYLARAPKKAAESLLAYVRANRLDGVSIDDERMRERNSVTGGPNRDLVTRFFRTLHDTLKGANRGYHLSFAAPPVIDPRDRFAAGWLDLKAITRYVDAVIPMGYTLNSPTIGWATNPEPLEGGGRTEWSTTRDLATLVRDYLRAMGGAREKLLLGVSLSFGGWEWRCRTAAPLSPTLGRGAARSLAECEARAREHGRRWDTRQRSPWYAYAEGGTFVQGWYNDRQAWREKLDWVRAQGLGGIGIWVLHGAEDPPDLWRLLRSYRGRSRDPGVQPRPKRR